MKPNRPPNPQADGHPAASTTERPSSPWQLFGARVRQMRDEVGLSAEDLTRTEVCPSAHLANIESGTVTPMRATAEYLDHHLNAHGRLLDAWARARISDHLSSDADIHPLQRDAARIREFQPGAIPTFFHTDGYATALADAARPLRERNSGVEAQRLRHGRYSIHAGTGAPVSLILDETVVRAVVGSAAIMREQLTHLHPRPLRRRPTHHRRPHRPSHRRTLRHPHRRRPPTTSTHLIRNAITELPHHEPRALTPGTADTSPTSTHRPAVPTTV